MSSCDVKPTGLCPWAFLLAFVMLLFSGCGAIITPPPHPLDPVTVYVADYGRHSTLLLPDSAGRIVEYTWGDWDWLGLNDRRWHKLASAIFFSRASAFGRRWIDTTHIPPTSVEPTQKSLGCEKLLTFPVARSHADALRRELDNRFLAVANTTVYLAEDQYCYAREPKHYWVFYECNDQTADWLRSLHCGVEGNTTSSHFSIAKSEQ